MVLGAVAQAATPHESRGWRQDTANLGAADGVSLTALTFDIDNVVK